MIDANFDTRRGATAKFAGSGGAVIGTYPDEAVFDAPCGNLAEIGCNVLKVQIDV